MQKELQILLCLIGRIVFALHEGDMPYELSLNYEFPNIDTLHRINITNVYKHHSHPI